MPRGRILLADEDGEHLESTRALLAGAGYEIVIAADGEEARTLAPSVDGVIASADLPLLDGFDLCTHVRERHETIPCYLILPEGDTTRTEACLAAGARNVLVRPLEPKELLFAARSLLNLRSLLRARAGSTVEGAPPIPPPGADDAVFFQFELFKRLLAIELKRAKRYGFPLSLLVVAPDGEPVPTGDGPPAAASLGLDPGALTLAVRAVNRAIRDIDVPVRFSDEQILVVMPHTDVDGALVVAERIRRRARSGEGGITVSIGATSLDTAGRPTFDQLLGRATRALLEARRAGGDRIARA
jgi:two-component system, cell cycle response regulator